MYLIVLELKRLNLRGGMNLTIKSFQKHLECIFDKLINLRIWLYFF